MFTPLYKQCLCQVAGKYFRCQFRCQFRYQLRCQILIPTVHRPLRYFSPTVQRPYTLIGFLYTLIPKMYTLIGKMYTFFPKNTRLFGKNARLFGKNTSAKLRWSKQPKQPIVCLGYLGSTPLQFASPKPRIIGI